MNSLPKISIIIVVHNAAKTLKSAINSIFEQSYKNVEVVVIDGGSTDGTLEILKNNKAENLIWISEPDKGIYDAMNKGIRICSGEWLYFLGADDQLYDKNVLENIFQNSNLSGVEFLYGNIKRSNKEEFYDGKFDYEKLLKKNISHQAIFYDKNIFEGNGNYNTRYKTHADWDMNLRCFENQTVRIKYVEQVIARFAVGGASRNYDIPFLRESLMPRKIDFLKANKRTLNNLKTYDEWWRFIRNSRFRNENDFSDSGYNGHIPAVILSMVQWQNKLPEFLLRNGLFSKLFMALNYLFCYQKIRN